MKELQSRYLERLSELYPTIAKASKEIINLQAILNLPKGTEHFLTDIHGEYEAFAHVLKNGSGSVRRKIEEVFGNTMTGRDKQALATLIYYPKEKMNRIKKTEENMNNATDEKSKATMEIKLNLIRHQIDDLKRQLELIKYQIESKNNNQDIK